MVVVAAAVAHLHDSTVTQSSFNQDLHACITDENLVF